VIFSTDAHYAADPECDLWGEHALVDEPSSAPLESLRPQGKNENRFTKRQYSAFWNRAVNETLRNYRVQEAVIVGLYSDICVAATAIDAFQLGYKVTIPHDATCALGAYGATYKTPLDRFWMAHLKTVAGARIVTSIDYAPAEEEVRA
jgi:nicotinamidase-related amidase